MLCFDVTVVVLDELLWLGFISHSIWLKFHMQLVPNRHNNQYLHVYVYNTFQTQVRLMV